MKLDIQVKAVTFLPNQRGVPLFLFLLLKKFQVIYIQVLEPTFLRTLDPLQIVIMTYETRNISFGMTSGANHI